MDQEGKSGAKGVESAWCVYGGGGWEGLQRTDLSHLSLSVPSPCSPNTIDEFHTCVDVAQLPLCKREEGIAEMLERLRLPEPWNVRYEVLLLLCQELMKLPSGLQVSE